MNKLLPGAAAAVSAIRDRATIAVGGFGVCGVPHVLLEALLEQGTTGLKAISNNCGSESSGLGLLLKAGRLRAMVASYIGENREFARQYLAGELEVELLPQGTLAEGLRAAGTGIPAFYTPTGAGTVVSEGGIPVLYSPDGSVAVASPPKETRYFGGRMHVLEHAIPADVALVKAWKADPQGNAVFRMAAANFNYAVATAGQVTLLEAEQIVDTGDLDPGQVHLPGIFVDGVIALSPEQAAAKPIEHRTVTPGPR